MTQADLKGIAQKLDDAVTKRQAIEEMQTDFDIDDAYAIQREMLHMREARGEQYVGPKLGFTSKAKMEQMGVNNIIVGFLTDAMQHDPSTPLKVQDGIHPRIEPELVFQLGSSVETRSGETPEQLSQRIKDATKSMAVGMEVIDSRYKDFKFTLETVVADNTSASRFLVGQWQPFNENIQGLKTTFKINGDVSEEATSDAILGDPLQAFDQLAEMVLRYGYALPAGAVILAGSMTSAVYLEPGMRIEAELDGFEKLSVTAS